MQKIIFYIAYLPIKLYGLYGSPRESLVFLFNLQRRITTIISDRASAYGQGIHPKHRLMQYHLFFTERLKKGEKVLDIGSGRGFLANEMALSGARVTGIELSQKNIDISNKFYNHPDLTFIHGDALKNLPEGEFDTAVMSNVLEHIEHRPDFLKRVQMIAKPKRWLIRVPSFDRDWSVALAKELGVDSRFDDTHFTEFTDKSFREEMHEAGLKITHFEKQWGEIWAELIPEAK